MSGEVRHLPGASPAAAGPLVPLRERGPRRGRGGRAFEQELAERGDAERPAAGAHAAPGPPAPRKPHAAAETGGSLDVLA